MSLTWSGTPFLNNNRLVDMPRIKLAWYVSKCLCSPPPPPFFTPKLTSTHTPQTHKNTHRSVHAADDALRRALVPTTSSSMAELREAFLAAMAQRGDEELFVEVTLIDGVNDSVEEAARLVEFLRPMGRDRVKVNLIPYNGAFLFWGTVA